MSIYKYICYLNICNHLTNQFILTPKTRSFGPGFFTQSLIELWTLNISYGKFSWDMLMAVQGY
jgi:hypothetical protein